MVGGFDYLIHMKTIPVDELSSYLMEIRPRVMEDSALLILRFTFSRIIKNIRFENEQKFNFLIHGQKLNSFILRKIVKLAYPDVGIFTVRWKIMTIGRNHITRYLSFLWNDYFRHEGAQICIFESCYMENYWWIISHVDLYKEGCCLWQRLGRT